VVALHEAQPRTAAHDPTLTLPNRVIALGVRDCAYDAAAIRWLEHEAVGGADAVHLVHAYVPCGPDAARTMLGRHIAAQAVQRLRTARPDLLVDGSAVQGLPEDVLHEFSSVVDMLVIGDDAGNAEARRITWRLQDAARCPVVTVPRSPLESRSGPVTVIAAGGRPSAPALHFGADAAARHGCDLRVLRLDAGGRGEPLAAAAATSSLLIAAGDVVRLLRSGAPLRCPVVAVPNALMTRP
jgi:hypothetical protein